MDREFKCGEHRALPWKAAQFEGFWYLTTDRGDPGEEYDIFEGGEEDVIRFAARACNNHDRLVETLRVLAQEAYDFSWMYQDARNRLSAAGIEPEFMRGHPEPHQMTMDYHIERARKLLAEIEKEESE